jgi:universal stress protein A
MITIRTILHPTDFSVASYYALRLASALAHDYGARLLILHVGEPPMIGTPMEAMVPFDFAAFESERSNQLNRVEPTEPFVSFERRLVIAPAPGEIIVETAQREPCDLIVLGTHGRTGLRRVLMGSVAEAVMRQAPCPVLTVRMPVPAVTPRVPPPVEEPVAGIA